MAKKQRERKPISHCQWHVAESLAWKFVRADLKGEKHARQVKQFIAVVQLDSPRSGAGVAGGVRSKGYG